MSPSTETVTCFITGETIPSADAHDWRFTYEFDAYVSPKGQRLVAKCLEINPNDDAEPADAELAIIHREWSA